MNEPLFDAAEKRIIFMLFCHHVIEFGEVIEVKSISKDLKAASIKANIINEKLLLYTNTSDFQLVHIKDIGMFVYNSKRRIWEIVAARCNHSIPLKRSIGRQTILDLDKYFIQVSQTYIININYLIGVEDNTCCFYPPFDKINDVRIARCFRNKFLERFNKL
jgi:hypothetical protein